MEHIMLVVVHSTAIKHTEKYSTVGTCAPQLSNTRCQCSGGTSRWWGRRTLARGGSLRMETIIFRRVRGCRATVGCTVPAHFYRSVSAISGPIVLSALGSRTSRSKCSGPSRLSSSQQQQQQRYCVSVK